eukprot:gene4582-20849_t
MPLVNETNKVVQILEIFREKLKLQGDYEQENEIAAVVQMLDSPLFRQIITIKDSLKELKEKVKLTPGVSDNDFDFSPTGELVFQPGMNMSTSLSQVSFGRDFVEGQASSDEKSFEDRNEIFAQMDPGLMKSKYADDIEFVRGLETSAEGREIDTLELVKPEQGGLGFSVVGLKSENRGELGIYVQGIQPGGVADREGNLHEGDQILAINGQRIDTGLSHQDAISILQRTRGHVELIVARGGIHRAPSDVSRQPSVASSSFISRSNSGASSSSMASMPTGDGIHWRQIETIELHNSGSGLGFGIVGGKNTGVIVKTILPGGVADRDGRLQSGDSILQINEVNLGGKGSDEVANILRKAGNKVKLVISRLVDEEPPEIPVRPDNESYEVETFEVKLQKNERGLGITIAGYVGDKTSDESSGIFIQNISEGSAAAQDGRLQVKDQIIEVDGKSLAGMNNLEAVEVLKNTGSIVSLIIARVKDQELSHVAHDDDFSGLVSSQDETFHGTLSKETEEELKDKYQELLGDGVDIYVCSIASSKGAAVSQFSKFHLAGGLGISLQGSTASHDNVYWHKIHSVYDDGPVGKVGLMKGGDYLLEINGKNVLHFPHSEVVTLIQGLGEHVRLVFARELQDNGLDDEVEEFTPPDHDESHFAPVARSEDDVKYVELEKGDKGLGFSILDDQLQNDASRTVIIIRSLVPGSSAAINGTLEPGDQLTSVNGVNLENASLDTAVQTLKAAPKGKTIIGIRKNILDISADEDLEMKSAQRKEISNAGLPENTLLPSAIESSSSESEEDLEEKHESEDEAVGSDVDVQKEITAAEPGQYSPSFTFHLSPLSLISAARQRYWKYL